MTHEPTRASLCRSTWAMLESAEKKNARLEAKALVAHVCNVDPITVTMSDEPVGESDRARISALIKRRLAGEPLARLLGHTEFYGLPLTLSDDTLIPRPDTECLVDAVLERRDGRVQRVLDIGTGSGAIILALLHHRPAWWGVASDVSEGALSTAAANARQLCLNDRLRFVAGSGTDPFTETGEQRFDIIVSNPPYIAAAVHAGLKSEVRDHEPFGALVSGNTGLEIYQMIAPGVATLTRPGGLVAFEIGYDQSDSVAKICADAGLIDITVLPDLAHRDRVILATVPIG